MKTILLGLLMMAGIGCSLEGREDKIKVFVNNDVSCVLINKNSAIMVSIPRGCLKTNEIYSDIEVYGINEQKGE